MPKALGRHGKNNDTESARLLRQYLTAAAPLDRFTQAAFDCCWRAVKFAVADALSDAADAACAVESSVPAGDEALYDAYRRLLAAYADFLALRDLQETPAEPRLQGLLDGIFTLVQSRLALGKPASAQNPIAAEKKDIAVAAIKHAAGMLDTIGARLRGAELPMLLTAVRMAAEGTDDPTDALSARLCELFEEESDMLYNIYQDTAITLWATLYDLSARHTANAYVALLREEHTFLASAAAAHADMLLDAAKNSEPAIQAHFLRVGATLKSLFIALDADWVALSPLLTAAKPEPTLLSGEALMEKCLALAVQTSFPVYSEARDASVLRVPYFRHTLSAALADGMAHGALCPDGTQMLEAFKVHLSAQAALTEEVVNVFRRIHVFYEAEKERLALAECADITHGVAETLAIKLDSLAESRAAFAAEADALLAQFAENAEPPALDDTARTQILSDGERDVLDTLWASAKNTRPAIIQDALDTVARHELLTKRRDMYQRTWTRHEETLQKKLTSFLKTHLLFECSTFEEILHYSVSRLRDAADPAVLAFAAVIDENAAMLPAIFAKHGIALIQPAPHDAFNGREHEVLMAEVHEDFKKGEIIKLMNCGYKQNDAVLLRANVIAAK